MSSAPVPEGGLLSCSPKNRTPPDGRQCLWHSG
jgi:hypothetical protein